MKFASLTFLAIVACIEAFVYDSWDNECASQAGVTQELRDEVARNKTVWFIDYRCKKYSRCIMENGGYLSASGEFNIDALENRMKFESKSDGKAELVKKCAVKKESVEEATSQFFKCMIQHLHPNVTL